MRTLFTTLFFLLSPAALAAASTVGSGSIQLVQIKNETGEVPASIKGVTGTVDLEAGTGELTIPLSAWDSGLEIRDNNVRGTFFKATEHPTASFTLESLALDGQAQYTGCFRRVRLSFGYWLEARLYQPN